MRTRGHLKWHCLWEGRRYPHRKHWLRLAIQGLKIQASVDRAFSDNTTGFVRTYQRRFEMSHGRIPWRVPCDCVGGPVLRGGENCRNVEIY